MPPKQPQRTRGRLLRAAEEAFAQRGYDAVSVAEICHRAGVSKGAFYHHFPSKQAIFQAVLEAWVQRLEDGLRAALAHAADWRAARAAMAQTFAQALRDTQSRIPLLLTFWHQAAHDPTIRPQVIAPFRGFEHILADYLRRAGHRSPAQTARALVAFATGVLLRATLHDPAAHDTAVLQTGLQRLLADTAPAAAAPEGSP